MLRRIRFRLAVLSSCGVRTRMHTNVHLLLLASHFARVEDATAEALCMREPRVAVPIPSVGQSRVQHKILERHWDVSTEVSYSER